MYSNLYQYTHDIDWFFLAKDKPIHIASNGGLLYPNTYTAVNLQTLQSYVEVIPLDYGFVLNEEMIYRYVEKYYTNRESNIDFPFYFPFGIPEILDFIENIPDWMKAYSWSFCFMAMRGFYSFDRDKETNTFFPVASPKDTKGHHLSEKIQSIICNINEIPDINTGISYDALRPVK